MKPKANPFLRFPLLAAVSISFAASVAQAVDYNWGDTVSANFTINATDVARDENGDGTFNQNSGEMGIYWLNGRQDKTFIHFDLSTLQGTTITSSTSLNYTVNATWGGTVTGSTINTANSAWTFSSGGATPAFTAISGATNATGTLATGQVATWSFGTTVMQGFVDSPSTFYGLVLNGATNTDAHLSSTPTLTGTYTAGEVRVLNGTDWSTASYDNGTNTLSISASNTVSGGSLSLATGTALSVAGSATLGSGSFSGNILNNGTISYASSTSQTLSGAISGTGSLQKSGAGILTLSGANTHSGGTTLSTGTLIAEINTTKNGLGTGAASVGSGTTLQLDNLNTSGSSVTISNAVSGTGTLKLNFAANTTGKNTILNEASLGSFNGAIELTNSGATGDKLNLANTGTVNASLLVNSGNTVYTGSGSNAFNGGTTISGNGNNEGLGAIRLEGGSTFGGNVNLVADAKIQGGNATTSVLSALVQSGAAGTQILTVDGSFTASGVIGGGAGTLAVQKSGAGSVTLSNTNTYTGGTSVTNGTLTLGHASNTLADSGAVNVNGGTLAIGGNSDTVGALTLTSGNINGSGGVLSASSVDLRSGIVTADLGGSGLVTKTTSGEVYLTGAKSFTGGLVINEGLVIIGNDNALGATNGAVTLNGGGIKGSSAITLGADRTITLGASGGYVSNGSNASWTINSKLTGTGFIGYNYDSSTSHSMTLTSSTNDYSGETRIGTKGPGYYANDVAAANLKLGAANALPYGAGKGNVIVGYDANGTAKAILDLNGNNTNINGLSTNNAANASVNNSSTTTATLTLGNGDNTASFGGVIQDTGTGALSLIKTGSGIQTLSGVNTYEGTTNISNGTLAVTGSGTINSTSGVAIASGSTFRYNSSVAYTGGAITNNGGTITGTGPIGVAVGLDSLEDKLAPGNSPGIQTYNVGQTWSSFTYQWETNNFTGTTAGTDFDQLRINGALALSGITGSYSLDVLSLTALNATGNVPNFNETSSQWTILNASNGITGFNPDYWTIHTDQFTSDPTRTGSFSLSADANNIYLNYTVIPEPRAALLGGLGLLALLRRRRCC